MPVDQEGSWKAVNVQGHDAEKGSSAYHSRLNTRRMDRGVRMEEMFFSTMMLTPVHFPDEIKVTLLGVDAKTKQRTGQDYSNDTNHSWDSIRRSVALSSPYLDECGKSLAEGLQVALATDYHQIRLKPTLLA